MTEDFKVELVIHWSATMYLSVSGIALRFSVLLGEWGPSRPEWQLTLILP